MEAYQKKLVNVQLLNAETKTYFEYIEAEKLGKIKTYRNTELANTGKPLLDEDIVKMLNIEITKAKPGKTLTNFESFVKANKILENETRELYQFETSIREITRGLGTTPRKNARIESISGLSSVAKTPLNPQDLINSLKQSSFDTTPKTNIPKELNASKLILNKLNSRI